MLVGWGVRQLPYYREEAAALLHQLVATVHEMQVAGLLDGDLT